MNPSRSCCVPATRDRTPPRTTARPMGWRSRMPPYRRRTVLVRADTGGGTHEFLEWLTAKPRRLDYSTGWVFTEEMHAATGKVPAYVPDPAYDGDGESVTAPGLPRPPAWWTWRAGPQARGSSCARNDRCAVRRC